MKKKSDPPILLVPFIAILIIVLYMMAARVDGAELQQIPEDAMSASTQAAIRESRTVM